MRLWKIIDIYNSNKNDCKFYISLIIVILKKVYINTFKKISDTKSSKLNVDFLILIEIKISNSNSYFN